MEIGCSSYTFRREFASRTLDLLGFVALAPDLGLDCIEVLTSDFPSVSRRFLAELTVQLSRFPVRLSALSPANDFAHPDADERRRQCDDLVAWMHIARELDVGILRTFTGHLHPGIDPAQAERWVLDCYARVLSEAERTNVTLAVENHDAVMHSAAELERLVMHFGSASLQLNPDPTNFVPGHAEKTETERERIYTELERIARFAVHAHLKIGPFDERGRPDNVNVERLLQIYRRAAYDGVLSFEMFRDGDATETVKKAVAFLRPLLDTV